MLDLVFLVLMIFVLMKSLKGDFNLLMCNIAAVVGVFAAIVGIITAFFSDNAGSDVLGVLNVFVLIIAFLLKPLAKHFAKSYQDKIDEEVRSYYEAEKHAKENFFRKVASDDAYLHAAERGANPPNANMPANGDFPQGNNGGMASNTAFPQNGNSAASPMAGNNAGFPQNGNAAGSPVAGYNAGFPQNGNAAGSPMAGAGFPQNGNAAGSPMAANNAVFPQNGNPAASPMAGNNVAFPQNGNAAASTMAGYNAGFPQNGNAAASPMAGGNAVFPQNGNAAASPMAGNNAAFPQNGDAAGSPMAGIDADSPKMEGISLNPETADTQPYDFSADNNYGLPYDLNAPIDLDRGIDDISPDNKK